MAENHQEQRPRRVQLTDNRFPLSKQPVLKPAPGWDPDSSLCVCVCVLSKLIHNLLFFRFVFFRQCSNV